MAVKYYLAIDIGASSGRHILAHLENGKMILEEIYRFSNGIVCENNEKTWNINCLFSEIKNGMKKCAEEGKIPESVGIDTWAVDFVLLDGEENPIGNAVSYRDARTQNMDKEVYKCISEYELYKRTGIQKQLFNTIYQIMSLKHMRPGQLRMAEKLLLIPDYFNFLLTGITATEYTNASTTQLVNTETKDWDWYMIDKLGYPKRLFQQIKEPGTVLGKLTKEIEREVGFSCNVVLPATHDTGSAVMAVPTEEDDAIYISSGTWSLVGTELGVADCSLDSQKHNFTNEGGYNYRFRYLKNIMGLWMIQSIKKEIGENYSYDEICKLASMQKIQSLIDCNLDRFLAPESMVSEIKKECERTGQEIPEGIAQIAAVVYNSLAKCYANAIKEIQEQTGKTYEEIHIVGGGANADYLNRLTAQRTGMTVYAGPTEATAVGNVMAQMIAAGELPGLREGRKCVSRSFEIKKYS